MNGLTNLERKNGKTDGNNIISANKKFQVDLENIPKLNLSKIKLLKPKIMASNGVNMMKINLNFIKDNNKNFQENSRDINNVKKDYPRCEELLKHPKIKNLKKMKEFEKSLYALGRDKSDAAHIRREIEMDNKTREKELIDMDSTNVSNININVNQKNNLNISNSDDLMRKNLDYNTKNKNVVKINEKNSSDTKQENESQMRSRNHINNLFSIKRNKSTLAQNTKTLLNTSVNLNLTLHQLANKLRQNNSNSHKKEEKVEILKNMVEGLTKLTTIMLEDSESESESNFKGNPVLNKSTTNNNLLISSTSGNIIKQGKLFTNSACKNTIDYDDTIKINNVDTISKNCKKTKLKIEDMKINKSFDTTKAKNNSFILEIQNFDRHPLESQPKSKNIVKNLIENRYSNSSFKNSMAARADSNRNLRNKLNATIDNFYTTTDQKLTEVKNNQNHKKRLNYLTTIDDNSKGEYISLNKNYLNNLTSTNADHKRFQIDKFEFRISKNFHQKPLKIVNHKINSSYQCDATINPHANKNNQVKKKVKKNETIEIEDNLPNYEFID